MKYQNNSAFRQITVSYLLLAVVMWAAAPASQLLANNLAYISPVEAMHLVEAHVPQLSTSAVELTRHGDTPAYIVEGTVEQDGYRGLVDARVARVISITKNGKLFYDWPGVTVIAHRGAVTFAPENTLPAFDKAIELGADLIEMDVRETKDGRLVVMHDETVDRTTDGTGKVTDLTLSEIKQLDAGSWFGPEFKGVRAPTLDEALSHIRGRALPDVDFKAGTPEKLMATLKEHGLLGKVTLYCGDWDLLKRTLEVSDDFLARPTVPIGRVGLPILIERFNPPLVNIDWGQFSESLVREVHLAGKKAFLNTMGPNDTRFGMLQAINAGGDYIQSDRLDVLMPLLRARGLHK